MADLFEAAQVFEACANLQNASRWLRQAAHEAPRENKDASSLQWTGEFLARLDSFSVNAASTSSGNLAVQATTARPTYYASLLKIRHRLDDSGLNTRELLIAFLKSLNNLLRSGGQDARKLTPKEMELGAEFLRELSNGLLAQLDHNGLPTHYPYLVQELAYHAAPN